MTTPATTIEVEAALRRLPGVHYVAVADLQSSMVIQVVPAADAEVDAVRRAAKALCDAQLSLPYVLDLAGSARPSRVQLLQVEVSAAAAVAVHLGYAGLCQVGGAKGADPAGAATATFDALAKLGTPVPFRLEAAATFEHPVGGGVMVILASDETGPRYGVASGANAVQAGARATLDALNRYLATHALA